MNYLSELLASDSRHTMEFFVTGLRDVSETNVDRDELLYNASVLAHYAATSISYLGDGAPYDLTQVYDQFVMDRVATFNDAAQMEAAGSQCLLLAGFFEDQQRRRHNIRWYAELGATFFSRAAKLDENKRRQDLFKVLAIKFELWRQRQARLARELRDMPYLLKPS